MTQLEIFLTIMISWGKLFVVYSYYTFLFQDNNVCDSKHQRRCMLFAINSVLSFWATTDPATVSLGIGPSAHAHNWRFVGHRKSTTVFGVFYRRPENATTYCQICYRACVIRYVPARGGLYCKFGE